MTTHIEDVLLWSLAQRGKPYIFGAEARATDPNPFAFDCSELVEWACARAGVSPKMPDGAYNQRDHCLRSGTGIPLGQGLRTRGALLFVGDGVGTGRDAITHVAWSLGDGTTIEARGSKWGVGTWPSTNRFDFAGLMPGVDYSPGHGQLTPEDEMTPEESQALHNVDTLLGENLAPAVGRIELMVYGLQHAVATLDPDVDEKALAKELGPLLGSALGSLDKADLQSIADAVADEIAARGKD